MYVCLCHAVTERHIANAVNNGARRLRDLKSTLKITNGCGRCASCARKCLQTELSQAEVNQLEPTSKDFHFTPTSNLSTKYLELA